MPDESKASNAMPTSEKTGAANLQQMNVSDLRRLIAAAQALESKKNRGGKENAVVEI